MIKMRDAYHADISHGINVRVYSTEPPEDRPYGLSFFLSYFIKKQNFNIYIEFYSSSYLSKPNLFLFFKVR